MRISKLFFFGTVLFLAAGAATAVRAADAVRPMTLPESVETAIRQSVLLHAAKEGVRGAEAQRKEAFTGFLPRFSTSYGYTRLNEDPSVTSPGGSFTIPPATLVTIPPSTYQAGTKDNYQWNVEMRQPVFAGGGILANYEMNRLGVEVARREETAALQDLVQEVKFAYFNILKAQRIREVADQSVERLKAHRDTAQGFFDVGMIPRNDLLYAEVELANGRQFLVRAENGAALARAKFNTLLRREVAAPVEVEDILDERPYGKTLNECISIALENRPEIRSLSLRLEQARSAVRLSKSEYYPNVSLVGNYAKYGDTAGVSGSPYRDQESWHLMAIANWNFWEWGKTKNRVEASRSRENQAEALLIHLRDQIPLEVKNAWLLLQEAEKQVQVSKQAIGQAEENFRIASERYREQVGTATDVIDAQTLLTRARADCFNAQGDCGIGRARLERAMGIAARGEGR
jgi:outer membrane protein TolC